MSSVKRHDIAEAVVALIKSGKSTTVIAQSLAGYLVSERRTREVMALVRDIEKLRFTHDGILEATVSSAHDIDSTIERRINDLFGAKKVYIRSEQEPSLVGGVRVRALDKQLDLSVESKLKQLKAVA